MEVIILSAPERDDLFAEIYDESGRLWAFVERRGNGLLSVKIVNDRVEPLWEFDLSAVLDVLQRAQHRLGAHESPLPE
jgi:hypothetical protein